MQLLILLLSLLFPLAAQDPIRYLPQQKTFVLDAGTNTYAFGINGRNELQHVYWGAKLHRDADFTAPREERGWASFDLSPTSTPDEYPAWGAGRFIETCLKATRADGVRDVVLKYASHQIKGDTLEVLTKDVNDDIRVTLV
jgi:alpha-galactosidase